MLSKIYRYFFPKEKTVSELLRTDIEIGSIITINLKNLSEIGIIDPSGYYSKRFDPEDLIKLQLTGTLTRKYNSAGIDFIELVVVKTNPRREKQYCIMIEETRNIKKINGK